MIPELQRDFETLMQQTAGVQRAVRPLNEAQLDWIPRTDAWNIRQIVEHLVLSDEIIGEVRELGSVETEAPLFRLLPRALRRRLILGSLKRDRVLPLPSSAVVPSGKLSLTELLSRWDAAHRAMERGLEKIQENEPRYFHPVMGPLTGLQMLELGQVHTAYHARQIAALQRFPGFPAS